MPLKELKEKKPGLLWRPPSDAWTCLIVMMLSQLLVFDGTHPLLAGREAHLLETTIDLQIPFVPAWVTVYFLSFLFWFVTVLWILSDSREHAYHFAGAYLIALLITGVIYIAYPVTIRRPEIVGSGFFDEWMRFLYWVDTPQNLCPSLHVLLSYFCWRGTMGCRKIPAWYRWFCLVFLILVCFSVLFVKQHYVIDIAAGILVGELALQIARSVKPERHFSRIEHKLETRKE
jgi:membrane-associated phospholipid phosphatase